MHIAWWATLKGAMDFREGRIAGSEFPELNGLDTEQLRSFVRSIKR